MSNAPTSTNGNGKSGAALQMLQTILVAVLLGATGWLANATLTNREEVVRMKTQLEERGLILKTIQDMLNATMNTQQQVLRDLVSLRDMDANVERRVTRLEGTR